MAMRFKVEQAHQLRGEEDWVFSVNGMKSKLLSVWYNEALFVTMRDGSYKEWTVMTVNRKDIDSDSTPVYKLGRW